MMGSAVVARSALGRKSGSTVLCICDGRVWHIMKKKKTWHFRLGALVDLT